MEYKVKSAPHIHAPLSTQRIMAELSGALLVIVVFSLIRSYTMGADYFLHELLLLFTAQIVSLATEAVYAYATKKKNWIGFLRTSFPWVTPLILVLMVPVNTSVYAVAVSTFIGVFFGKMVFGGFGQNIFNPAAVGRAVTFGSFATSVTEALVISATPTGTASAAGWIFSREGFATFLGDFGGLSNLFLGNYDGALGETCTALILLVGIYLCVRKIIDWYIPLVYLATIFIGTFFIGLSYGIALPYACFHLLTGGVMFGAFFMLTDPVTNPNTRAGKIVFAAFVAVFTVLIRFLANLPEGVLFAILLGNLTAPAIDKYFDGKSVLRERKDRLTVYASLALSVGSIFLFGFGIRASEYKSLRVPEFEHGESILLSDMDIAAYEPVLESRSANVFVVAVNGFGTLPAEFGGQGGKAPYQKNMFEIELDNSLTAVVGVKCIRFGDTSGIGDGILEEGFLLQANGKKLVDSLDVVSNATYSSKSLFAAIKYLLSGEYRSIPLTADFAEYEAKIVSHEGDVYHISVRGFGTLKEGMGPDYSLNEFAVTVENGKVKSVVCTHFGDTVNIGDFAVKESNLQKISGCDLTSSLDVTTNATFTSKSLFAAVKLALESEEK